MKIRWDTATVGDLRQAMERLPDDAPLEATHDGGYSASVVGLRVQLVDSRKFDQKGNRLSRVLGLVIDVD